MVLGKAKNLKEGFIMSTALLKYIALILMTIDHIGEFIPGTPIWFRYLGRLAAPIFFFCAVEGIMHTHDRKKYLLRLYIASVLMATAEFILLMIDSKLYINNNIFSSIFLGTTIVYILEEFKDKKRKRNLLLLAFVGWQALSFIIAFVLTRFDNIIPWIDYSVEYLLILAGNWEVTEGALYLTLAILLFYFLRGDKKKLAIGYTVYCALFFVATPLKGVVYAYEIVARLFNRTVAEIIVGLPFRDILGLPISGNIFGASFRELIFEDYYQWMMIFALPIILCYNGKRGNYPKWLFYIYYPAHLFVLALISMLI